MTTIRIKSMYYDNSGERLYDDGIYYHPFVYKQNPGIKNAVGVFNSDHNFGEKFFRGMYVDASERLFTVPEKSSIVIPY